MIARTYRWGKWECRSTGTTFSYKMTKCQDLVQDMRLQLTALHCTLKLLWEWSFDVLTTTATTEQQFSELHTCHSLWMCLLTHSYQDKQVCDSCKCDLTMWFFMHPNCPWLPGAKMCPKEHPVPFWQARDLGFSHWCIYFSFCGCKFVSFVPKLLWYSYTLLSHFSILLNYYHTFPITYKGFRYFPVCFFLRHLVLFFRLFSKEQFLSMS